MIYLNGEYTAEQQARVSVLDRGFVFGDGVYEVWRVVNGRLFEAERHLARLERGLRELAIAPPREATLDGLLAIADRLVDEAGAANGEATVYVEITRGAAPRTHYFPPRGTSPTLFAMASPFKPSEARTRGATVITQPDIRWLRCDIKTIQLLPNVLARQAAAEAGATEAIFVRDGVITEGTHTTVFAVVDGVLRTHPANHLVLPGVTREVVLDLARGRGQPAREDAITREELARADEVFLSGTTTDITPVIAVDGRPVAGGTPGSLTRSLLEEFLSHLHAPALPSSTR